MKERIEFDGTFTQEIRDIMRMKRLKLGLSFHRAAGYMGVNWSTFRKWENGTTKDCDVCYRPRIEKFINGDYDEQLIETFEFPRYDDIASRMSDRIHTVMENFSNAYAICNRENSQIGEEMLEKVDEVTHQALEAYLKEKRKN